MMWYQMTLRQWFDLLFVSALALDLVELRIDNEISYRCAWN